MEVACAIDFLGQGALLKEMDCVYGGEYICNESCVRDVELW